MKSRVLVAALCLASLNCAATRPAAKIPDLSRLAEADAQVRLGCYDCLLDARAIYRHIAAGPGRPIVLERLFETSLLLTLRHKELALDSSEMFAEAQAIAKELPPEVDAARYLAIADAVPPDDIGTPHVTMAAFARNHASFIRRVDGELAWLQTGALAAPVRDYLALALDCGYLARPGVPGQPLRPRDVRQPPPGAPPLIAYRTAICGVLNQPVLYRLRDSSPRFVEAALFLARFDLAVADQLGPGHAVERLEESRARFPSSPLAGYLSGSIQQMIGDCDAALGFYDETIAVAPLHENAMLGRTICLSYLKRPAEAIQTATHMIELDTDELAEAYYWRAWNREVMHDLGPARDDIGRAWAIKATIEVVTLSGVIKYEQDDLDPSERDLNTARQMAAGDMNCPAIWYLGLLQAKRQAWIASAHVFEASQGCYERTSTIDKRRLEMFRARTDIDPDFKARRIAALEASAAASTSQLYASAFNAANYYATAGDIPMAKKWIEVAAVDPALAEKVVKLRDWLKDK